MASGGAQDGSRKLPSVGDVDGERSHAIGRIGYLSLVRTGPSGTHCVGRAAGEFFCWLKQPVTEIIAKTAAAPVVTAPSFIRASFIFVARMVLPPGIGVGFPLLWSVSRQGDNSCNFVLSAHPIGTRHKPEKCVSSGSRCNRTGACEQIGSFVRGFCAGMLCRSFLCRGSLCRRIGPGSYLTNLL